MTDENRPDLALGTLRIPMPYERMAMLRDAVAAERANLVEAGDAGRVAGADQLIAELEAGMRSCTP